VSAVLALLVAIGVAADFGARSFAEGLLRDQIVQGLALPEGTELSVEIGPGSIIGQALGGRINSVTVSADAAALGVLTGDLQIVATGIPVDVTQPISGLRAQLIIAEGDLQPLVGTVGELPIQGLTLANSSIVVSTETSLFGKAIDVVVTLVPSAQDGQLILTPVAVTAGGLELSLEAAAQWPYSLVLQPVVKPHPLCVAQYLPQAAKLSAAAVINNSLVLEFTANNVIIGDGGLTTLGSCG
jgi:hypothetical protein